MGDTHGGDVFLDALFDHGAGQSLVGGDCRVEVADHSLQLQRVADQRIGRILEARFRFDVDERFPCLCERSEKVGEGEHEGSEQHLPVAMGSPPGHKTRSEDPGSRLSRNSLNHVKQTWCPCSVGPARGTLLWVPASSRSRSCTSSPVIKSMRSDGFGIAWTLTSERDSG